MSDAVLGLGGITGPRYRWMFCVASPFGSAPRFCLNPSMCYVDGMHVMCNAEFKQNPMRDVAVALMLCAALNTITVHVAQGWRQPQGSTVVSYCTVE